MKNPIGTITLCGGVAVVLALCGTAQAQTPVTGWGLAAGDNGGTGAWTVSDLGSGNFTVGGGTLSSAAAWGAQFTPITLTVGSSIDLTGSLTYQGGAGSLGGGAFRFGVENLSSLSSLTGTGYSWALPTGGTGASGASSSEITGHNGGGNVISWNGGSYNTTRVSGGSNNNSENAGPDTYTFNLEYSLVSATEMNVMGSFDGSSLGYTESVDYNDAGGNSGNVATATFNSVVFYASNAGTTATGFNFSNVEIQAVPEPTSMALIGSALVAGVLVRRNKK